jgi:hypothetical protein
MRDLEHNDVETKHIVRKQIDVCVSFAIATDSAHPLHAVPSGDRYLFKA